MPIATQRKGAEVTPSLTAANWSEAVRLTLGDGSTPLCVSANPGVITLRRLGKASKPGRRTDRAGNGRVSVRSVYATPLRQARSPRFTTPFVIDGEAPMQAYSEVSELLLGAIHD